MCRTPRSDPGVSRRRFLGTASAGTVLGASLLGPESIFASGRDDEGDRAPRGRPKAIPLGVAPFAPFAIFIHHFPPTPGQTLAHINEQSQITDFNGLVGRAVFRGGGTGTNTVTGQTRTLAYQADMGFNQGEFIGDDGRRHTGTFGFI
jgi:hypothetical protein